MIPDLRFKSVIALSSGESLYAIEQALESELIQFVQMNGESESLQYVVDYIILDISDKHGGDICLPN
tara:strand:+ start:417 stop:617 length:201 start_codon:yes stop_codon:yes gene_type:complete